MSAKTFPTVATFNEADEHILNEVILNRRLKAQNHPLYNRDVLMVQPANAQEFLQTGSLQANQLVAGTRQTLFSWKIPRGFYGVMTDRACWVTGSSFIEGSNAINWNLAIGDGWLLNHGNIIYSIGPDFSTTIVGQGGVLLVPNQTVTFSVTTVDASTLALDAVIMARIKGWLSPVA